MSLNLDHYKKRIEDELIKIQEGLNQTQQSAGTVILDQSSVGRLSRMDAMQQQAMAQGLRGRLQLRHRKLKGALVRIEAGNFGCCSANATNHSIRLAWKSTHHNCFASTVCRSNNAKSDRNDYLPENVNNS